MRPDLVVSLARGPQLLLRYLRPAFDRIDYFCWGIFDYSFCAAACRRHRIGGFSIDILAEFFARRLRRASILHRPRSRMGCKLKLAFDHSVGLRRVYGFYLISIINISIVVPNGVDVSHQAECVAALAVRLEKLRLFLQSSRSPDQREGSTPLQRSIEASPPVTS